MARIEPSEYLPDVPVPSDLDLRLGDLVVILLVLAFFVVTTVAVLRRLAVL